MSEGDKMLERVRRLLAKAEGAATEAERDAYNGKAAELIARYGIDEALLAAGQSVPPHAADRIVLLDPPYARDKGSLLAAVATPLRVRVVLKRNRPEPSRPASTLAMHLFGMAADLERVDVLYTSLLVQAAHGLAVVRPKSVRESVAAYRRSWMLGFAYVIGQRLAAAEAAVRRQAEGAMSSGAAPDRPSVSLVLADQTALVEEALARAYPRLRTARGRLLSGSGSADGVAAGRRADIGGQRLQRRRQATLRGG